MYIVHIYCEIVKILTLNYKLYLFNINYMYMEKLIALILFLFVLSCVLLVKFYHYRTSPIKVNGKIKHGSIAEMQKVNLNNSEQMILLRGADVNNDILLFIHGGPGSPDMASIRYYNSSLEDQFIVVTWDQRGCGKSINKFVDYNSFSIDIFLNDLLDLVEYLRKKYNKDRILLAGHSWGSILGFKFAEKYPHLLKAYIGISQVANMKEGEIFSYQIAVSESNKANDEKIKAQMNSIESPVEGKYRVEGDLDKQRDVLLKLGLLLKNNTSYKPIIKAYIKSSEFCFRDLILLQTATKKTMKALWDEVCCVNFIKTGQTQLNIPFFLITGKEDCVTPVQLSKNLFDKISSPHKEYFVIENSSHFPFIDNPSEFQDAFYKIKKSIA